MRKPFNQALYGSLYCLLAFLFIGQLSAQQGGILKGYYVTSNDTVRGYIGSDIELNTAKFFRFFPTKTSKQTIIYPREVDWVFIEKGSFLYKSIPHSYTLNDSLKITERRFGLRVAEGKYDLYRVEISPEEARTNFTDLRTFFFYIEDSNGVDRQLELVEESVTSSSFKFNEKYKGLLKYMMQDYPNIEKKVEKIRYSSKSIGRLVNDYNKFSNDYTETKTLERSNQIRRRKTRYVGLSAGTLLPVSSISGYQNSAKFSAYLLSLNKLKGSRVASGFSLDFGLANYNQDLVPIRDAYEMRYIVFGPYLRCYLSRKENFRLFIKAQLGLGAATHINQQASFRRVVNPDGSSFMEFAGYKETLDRSGFFAPALGVGLEVKEHFFFDLFLERNTLDINLKGFVFGVGLGFQFVSNR